MILNMAKNRFPKCAKIKEIWINATHRAENWFPNKNSVICSRHFTKDCYQLMKKRRLLFNNAVPTLMLPILGSSQNIPQTASSSGVTTVTYSTKSEMHSLSMISTNLPEGLVRTPGATTFTADTSQECLATSSNAVLQPIFASNIAVSEALNFAVVTKPSSSVVLDTSSTYSTPRKRRLSRSIIDLSLKLKNKNVKIKRLRDSNRILKKKYVSLKLLLEELEKKNLITQENTSILSCIGVQNQEILKRQVLNASSGKISRSKYSPELRTFALTLNFYSTKAYKYVRKCFNTCLPSLQTLSKWYRTIDGRAGFTREAFNAIKLKSEHSQIQFYGALIFDEMKIKSKIEYVPSTQRTYGYEDFGCDLVTDSSDECTEALVFLVVPFNAMFKVPIGYFLLNKVTAEQKAFLVTQAIKMCKEANFIVKAVTCDGCPANISMAKKLGCNLDPFNLKTSFVVDSIEVAFFLDPAHMIKLLRNSFEFYNNFIDNNDNIIKWVYIQRIHELQKNEAFHLANKLRNEHLNFKNNIMKVKLATQLFSRSVATALLFCNTELKIEGFKDSLPTSNMLMIINDLFDILDSKTHGYGFKRAINAYNYPKVCQRMDEAKEMLLSLKVRLVTKNKEKVVNLIESPRHTGFLGLCVCIESVKNLHRNLILDDTCPINYLPIHKISQDHLELLFCNIRSSGGSNDNPTPRQFEAIYKKILIHTELNHNGTGNCVPLENISILNCSSSVQKINYTTERCERYEDKIDNEDHDFIQALQQITLSLFAENIIDYIAGYVVKSLIKKITCNKCVHALVSLSENRHSFIYARDKGGLIYPSETVITICRRCEVVMRSNDSYKSVKPERRTMYFVTKTLNTFANERLFPEIWRHQFDFENTNHIIDLAKSVMEKYINTRLAYLTKNSDPKHLVRRVYTKLIHFKNQ